MRTFDPERFLETRDTVLCSAREQMGIGTLAEKSLHLILKNYYEPITAFHEQKIGRFVADILNEDGVIEIQTRSFSAMRKKLNAFLDVTDVTVVHPVVHNKWMCWVDPETGETTKKRKSPKTGTVYDAFWELGAIPELLSHPRLTLCLVLLDMDETKLLNGYGKSRKYRATRADRIPRALLSETFLHTKEDYASLLPDTLPERFSRKELALSVGQPPEHGYTLMRVFSAVGVITEDGKRGNEYLYRRTSFIHSA